MEIFREPSFGIITSIVAYQIGKVICKKFPLPIYNPLLLSTIIIITFLVKFDIPFEDFNNGGQYITFLLGPATVALALPLYKQSTLLKKHLLPILVGIFSGVATSVVSVIVIAKAFGLEEKLIISLMPKSITTPIGMSLSQTFNGEVSLTILAIAITGTFGAIFSPLVISTFRINNRIAKGLAIGTTTHALGTTRAMEMGEIEGAMSGLAIGLAGIGTVIVMPILIRVIF